MVYKDPETFGVNSSGFNAVSVIIPAYQAEETIERSVTSALSIGSALREIVVVDDGSTDDTSVIVARLANCDNRVRLIRQQNKGRSSARNRGVREARGAAVMFLDADDFLLEPAFPLIEKALDSPYDLIVFPMLRSDGVDTFERPLDLQKVERLGLEGFFELSANDVLDAMVDGNVGALTPYAGLYEWNSACSRLYKRDILLGISNESTAEGPFDPSLRFSEDKLLNIEYLSQIKNEKVHFGSVPLYHWDLGASHTVAVIRGSDVSELGLFCGSVGRLRAAGLLNESQETKLIAIETILHLRRCSHMMGRENIKMAEEEWGKVARLDNAVRAFKKCLKLHGADVLYSQALRSFRWGFPGAGLMYLRIIRKGINQVKKAHS